MSHQFLFTLLLLLLLLPCCTFFAVADYTLQRSPSTSCPYLPLDASSSPARVTTQPGSNYFMSTSGDNHGVRLYQMPTASYLATMLNDAAPATPSAAASLANTLFNFTSSKLNSLLAWKPHCQSISILNNGNLVSAAQTVALEFGHALAVGVDLGVSGNPNRLGMNAAASAVATGNTYSEIDLINIHDTKMILASLKRASRVLSGSVVPFPCHLVLVLIMS